MGVEVGRVRHDGIDDERPGAVVCADVECDVPSAEAEATLDARASLRGVLVDHRSVQAQRLAASCDDHVVTVEPDRICAGNLEADPPGIGARGDDEVELRRAMRAVEHEVRARIDAAIDDAAIHRHVAMPCRGIIAGHVMRLTRQFVLGRDLRVGGVVAGVADGVSEVEHVVLGQAGPGAALHGHLEPWKPRWKPHCWWQASGPPERDEVRCHRDWSVLTPT